MALVSRQRSALNPNAPLFVPAVYRQVEDFSPKWWELVQSSSWFRDYWLSQNPEERFDGSAGDEDEDFEMSFLLPETFDFGSDLEIDTLEEFVEFEFETESPGNEVKPLPSAKMDAKALLKNLIVPKSPEERSPKSPVAPAKFQMKPAYNVSPKHALQRIHQPR